MQGILMHPHAPCSYPCVISWSKTISEASMEKGKIGKCPHVGALSFKTCQESFSLANAVPLTSSHAAEARCITMTWECPLCQGNLHSNSSLGEGAAERRGGGRGKQKGTRLPPRSRLIHEPKEGNPSPVGSNRSLCARHSPVKAAPTHAGSLLPLSLVLQSSRRPPPPP